MGENISLATLRRTIFLFVHRICLYMECSSISRIVGSRSSHLKFEASMSSTFAVLPRAVRRLAVAAALVAAAASPAAASDPLVSTDWLNSHRADVVVIDVRHKEEGAGSYAAGHIPGAISGDFEKAGWRVTRDGVPLSVPTKEQLEKLIGSLGISNDSQVVVVPAGESVLDFGAGARVYWTLKYSGVKDISLLDGGFKAWKDAKLPVDTGIVEPKPATFAANFNDRLRVELKEVEHLQSKGGATFVDARPPAQFSGKVKTATVLSYGHLPGAVNIDSTVYFDNATHRLKPKAELASLSEQVKGPSVSYCNTGHLAATDWFVLHEVLGKETRLYAGSMTEWTRDPSRPVESSRTKLDDLKAKLGFGQ
jgi:thiosulfate/3-mercaptopyruvate sulfurtransferase